MIDDEHLKKTKEAAVEKLFRIPGVHSVAIGPKYSGGQPAGELSIIVSLTRKRPPGEIPPSEMIPAEINGIKTDVVERQPQTPCATTVEDGERRRPILGGTQIQLKWVSNISERTETGTLGFLGRTTNAISSIVAGQIVGVTCAHVVADPNNGPSLGHKVGQSEPAECSQCSGCCNHIIGRVLRLVDSDGSKVDVAAIAITPGLTYFADIQEIGAVRNFHVLQPTDLNVNPPHYPVKKRGRTTGLTRGDVRSVGGTSLVGGITLNDNEIAVVPDPATPIWDMCGDIPNLRSFACEGDSGSALMNNNDEVVGVVRTRNLVGEGFAVGIDIVKVALGIEVETATHPLDLRTAPEISGTLAMAIDGLPLLAAPFAPPEQRLFLKRAQKEILATESGRCYEQLVLQHQEEVRKLIHTNRRVAAVWHRNGGPAIIQGAVEAVEHPDRKFPAEIDGRPIPDCLAGIIGILAKYGSTGLGNDMTRYGPSLAAFGGLSYSQVLQLLGSAMS
jgi:hypothetical protein